MKCPKCGSEAVFEYCKPTYDCKCGECNNSWQSEPTTAEMLLWLVQNLPLTADTKHIYFVDGSKEKVFGGGIESQIRAAYNEAKKQEVIE